MAGLARLVISGKATGLAGLAQAQIENSTHPPPPPAPIYSRAPSPKTGEMKFHKNVFHLSKTFTIYSGLRYLFGINRVVVIFGIFCKVLEIITWLVCPALVCVLW